MNNAEWLAKASKPIEVVAENDIRWNVKCQEPGCDHVISVGKRIGVPVDPADPDSQVVWTSSDLTPRWCVMHPPTQ